MMRHLLVFICTSQNQKLINMPGKHELTVGGLFQFQDFLGEAVFALSTLVSSFQGKMELGLWDSENDEPAGEGKLVLRYEERTNVTEIVGLSLKASDLVGQKLGTKPIVLISRSQEDGSWAPIYRSESNQEAAPRWNPFEITMAQLCNGDLDRTLKLEVTWGALVPH